MSHEMMCASTRAILEGNGLTWATSEMLPSVACTSLNPCDDDTGDLVVHQQPALGRRCRVSKRGDGGGVASVCHYVDSLTVTTKVVHS